ncbi:hypothetical protein Ait01nite_082920 [Actinoplanes italicus]|nr:hypothetical protein Ait01nite_082920 [Actinoplanes italicus]
MVGSGRSDGVTGLLSVVRSGEGDDEVVIEGGGEADEGDEAGDSTPFAQPAITVPATTARPIRNVVRVRMKPILPA